MAGRYSVEGVFGMLDKITRPIARLESRMGRFMRGTASGSRKAGAAFGRMSALADSAFGRIGRMATGTAAKLASLTGGLSAIAAGMSIIRTGADFEQAISAVGAVGLQTREQIKPLDDLALRLGARTQFAATQAAYAMEIMARAGFKNSEIIAGVPGVLTAAVASGLEMAEVSDVVSNALKGMGL